MSWGDKAFYILMLFVIVGGSIAVTLQEHRRSTSCAALGGIVVDLKCVRIDVIEGWKP